MVVISGILILVGALVFLIAGIGVYRFEYTLFQIHIVAKASSLGIVLLLFGVGLQVSSAYDITKALLAILLCFFTVPLSCHMMARFAFKSIQQKRKTIPSQQQEEYFPDSF